MAHTQQIKEDVWIPSTCGMCFHGCCIRVHRVDGVVVGIEGNPTAPDTQGGLCAMGHAGIMTLYDPYRVKAPMKRTNPRKGAAEDPRWVEITWEEAINLIVEKLKPIRKEDPNDLIYSSFQYQTIFHGGAWGLGFGTSHASSMFSGAGVMCGAGMHIIGEVVHSSFMDWADFQYCNYLIIAGAGLFESHYVKIPSARWVGEGREKRGLKLVVMDPRGNGAAAKADEWLPVRPGTDGAVFLAMMNVLVNEVNIYDAEFLKKVTNAPYLIGPDRYPVRDKESKKPLIWDPVDNRAKTYDDPTIKDYALLGRYIIEDVEAQPAFNIFKEHIRQYTPEWAEGITTIDAARIRRIAKEFGEAARIGSTIVIDGKEYPYRPACVMGYRGLNNHTNGLGNVLAYEILDMLVGAILVPGGLRSLPWNAAGLGFPYPERLTPGRDGVVSPSGYALGIPEPFQFPPQTLSLREFWPGSFVCEHIPFLTQSHPEKFKLQKTAKALIQVNLNPMMNCHNPSIVAEALSSIPFMVSVTTYIDETANLADVIIPDCTYLERWAITNGLTATEGTPLQQPVVPPLYNSRNYMEVLIEVADRMGFLTGTGGMLFWLNQLYGKEALDINKKYNWKEILAAQVEAAWGKPLEWFMEHGHNLRLIPTEKSYLTWKDHRLPFYQDWFMEQGDKLRRNMEEAKVKEQIGLDPNWFCDGYRPLPTWEPARIHLEPEEYDMYTVNYKGAIGRFGTLPATNPWLMEIAERDPYYLRILINTETAKKKGLKDDDWVLVESKVAKVKGQIRCTELMHHECLGFAANLGHYNMKHPIALGKGVNCNTLLPYGIEYTGGDCGGMEGSARVKVYKA
jgi:anaerobic selenocysteine-containing dehydrogenase